MTKKKKEYIPVFARGASIPSVWHKVPNKGKKVHKIGKHGAIGWETQDGSICAECGKKIKR